MVGLGHCLGVDEQHVGIAQEGPVGIGKLGGGVAHVAVLGGEGETLGAEIVVVLYAVVEGGDGVGHEIACRIVTGGLESPLVVAGIVHALLFLQIVVVAEAVLHTVDDAAVGALEELVPVGGVAYPVTLDDDVGVGARHGAGIVVVHGIGVYFHAIHTLHREEKLAVGGAGALPELVVGQELYQTVLAVDYFLGPLGSLAVESGGVHLLVALDGCLGKAEVGQTGVVLLAADGLEGSAGAHDDAGALGHGGRCHGGIYLGQHTGGGGGAYVAALIVGVVAAVHQTGGALQLFGDVFIYLGDGLAGRVESAAVDQGHFLERYLAVCAHQQEVRKGTVEDDLADGVVTVVVGDAAHAGDVLLGHERALYQGVAAKPHGIDDAGVALEVACAQGGEAPVGTRGVVGVELEHLGEV